MTDRPPSFRLAHDQARQLATAAIWRAPEGWYVKITPPTRSLEANARFHAMLSDIVKAGYKHDGRAVGVDFLKVLFVSAWQIETGKGSDIVKGLADEPVQLRRSTTTMSPTEISEAMIIVERFCAERGIQLREPS